LPPGAAQDPAHSSRGRLLMRRQRGAPPRPVHKTGPPKIPAAASPGPRRKQPENPGIRPEKISFLARQNFRPRLRPW
jgi:hypothetical protein